MGHFLCQAHVKEKKVGKAKKKNHRTLLILLFSLAVLAVVAFFAMHKIGSRSLSFSRKERFFLNGTLNNNVASQTAIQNTPGYTFTGILNLQV